MLKSGDGIVSATAFAPLPADQARTLLLQWLAVTRVPPDAAAQITARWADAQELGRLSGEQVLDRIIESLAAADETISQTVASVREGVTPMSLNLEGPRAEPFARSHIQLYLARALTQHRYYDEALALLEQLEPQSVVDPASLFFYRATCRLKLLQMPAAADDLTLLLNSTLDVPQRFRVVAELMQQEVAQQAEGLAAVADLMSDVHRRLDLQRADDPVQKREDEVIAAIDKLLQDMEQQQQQQQESQGQGGGNQNQPGEQGAEQSALRAGPAVEGDADRKDLKENGNWGMLDQQAETKARELIRQQFPPNFLDAISRYTQKVAEQKK
jgi:hypothetical protein